MASGWENHRKNNLTLKEKEQEENEELKELLEIRDKGRLIPLNFPHNLKDLEEMFN